MNKNVSIIVPVYGVEQYIEDCITSVMEIDREDVECIIVNDATPDSSLFIINDLLSSYTGKVSFKVIEHEVNQGLSASRNTGLEHCSGEYIYFLDSDDYLLTSKFCKLLDIALENKLFDIVQGSFSSNWFNKSSFNLPSEMDRELAQKYYLQGAIESFAWGKFVKKDFILCHNLFFKVGIVGREDIIWLIDQIAVVDKIRYVDIKTYFYRENQNSILHSRDYLQSRFDGINYLLNYAISRKDSMNRDYLRYMIMQHGMANVYALMVDKNELDVTSISTFKKTLASIKKEFHSETPFLQSIIWTHIFSPLRCLLKIPFYKQKFFSLLCRIREI